MKMRRSLVETAFMLELEHSLPTPKKSFDAIVEHVLIASLTIRS
jgi:hypothetical protein